MLYFFLLINLRFQEDHGISIRHALVFMKRKSDSSFKKSWGEVWGGGGGERERYSLQFPVGLCSSDLRHLTPFCTKISDFVSFFWSGL